MATPPAPPYAALPLDPAGPPGNAWGRFGAADELGTLNLLAPAVVARAAREEIRTGARVSLDLPLDHFRFPFWGRAAFRHDRTQMAHHINDDALAFNTQSATQWDGFRHYAPPSDGATYYHGRTRADLEASGALGIDTWARAGGVTGRGVLLDWADWAACNNATLPPFERSGIPVAQLKAIAREQKIEFRAGDTLFVRTGFVAAYNALGADEQKAISARENGDVIGVQASHELLEWLWESQFAAIASDALAWETAPPQAAPPDVCVHHLLSKWGLPIGELFDLEELARHCRQMGRASFFLSSVPLKAS